MGNKGNKSNIKQSIGVPVAVNLITAALLLLGAIVLKRPLLRLLYDEVPDYPVYCVGEPVEDPNHPGKMSVELFIINQRSRILKRKDLYESVQAYAGNDVARARSTKIELVADRGVKLSSLVEDKEFNQQKGSLRIDRAQDESRCTISIDEIQPNGILRVNVATSRQAEDWLSAKGRTAHLFLPFKIRYPGVKQAGS